MKTDRRLMVEFGDDFRVDEYRIRGRQVEFRARRPDGALTHEAMDSQDVRVRLYGTTAIVTALTSSKARYMNQEFSTRERATDVFVKLDGKWECVITHLTTFAKK
jgi:hypothetical protein